METVDRREALKIGSGLLLSACASSHPPAKFESEHASLEALERRIGGRLGVFALDTGSGRVVARRADERFAMCSTFKWVLGAAVLERIDRTELGLDERLPFGPDDMLEPAPVTRPLLEKGTATIAELVSGTIRTSDNPAANLLLAKIGGPSLFTDFVRRAGDATTRLDRNEPTLNENAPGDPRDTTTPRAMAELLGRILWKEEILSKSSRELLGSWLRSCETGKNRLRGGFPADWDAGDKTGTGNSGAANDVAFVVPPGRAPIVVATYVSESPSVREDIEAVHVDVARLIVRSLT